MNEGRDQDNTDVQPGGADSVDTAPGERQRVFSVDEDGLEYEA